MQGNWLDKNQENDLTGLKFGFFKLICKENNATSTHLILANYYMILFLNREKQYQPTPPLRDISTVFTPVS